jgi:hypothetical protein
MSINRDKEAKSPLLGNKSEQFQGFDDEAPRKFHDLMFTFLFIAACAFMVVISGVAFSKGDPTLLNPHNWEEQAVHDWLLYNVAELKVNVDVLAYAAAMAVVLGFVWIQLLKMFTKLFV